MTEIYAERKKALAIGDYVQVCNESEWLHGKHGKVRDVSKVANSATVRIDGISYLLSQDVLRPVLSLMEDIKPKTKELMDITSSSDKHEDEMLNGALSDRQRGYRKTARIQRETLEIADRIDKILNKRKRETEELEAWKNGQWFDKYWEPSYTKISSTVGAQLLNVAQLIACCTTGPIGVIVGIIIFTLALYINYTILDRMSKDG
jgi:hypothetical protein